MLPMRECCFMNSISSTVNCPAETTDEDVAAIYFLAWKMGCKGITVYRYASKPTQVLELGAAEEAFHYAHASRCDPMECRL